MICGRETGSPSPIFSRLPTAAAQSRVAALKAVAAFLIAALPLAAIDGVVTNRTTGKTQGNSTVTLFKLGGAGPESLESVKTGPDGKFTFAQNLEGPGMVQAVNEGVVYIRMLPPGMPRNNIQVDVYSASRAPGDAKLSQHMVLFEAAGERLNVSENFLFSNPGQTAYNDPANGTLRFYVPPAGSKAIELTATAPNSVPVRQAPLKTGQPDIYKLDFAIKPGETTIQLTYSIPYKPPLKFEGRRLVTGGPTSLIAPVGMEIKGDGLEPKGQEPRTQASIFQTRTNVYAVEISGEGVLRRTEGGGDSEESGPALDNILPKIYDKQLWVLTLAFGMLLCAFVLLWRAGSTADASSVAKGKKK